MYEPPQAPSLQLEPAPGAKAATRLGIWSLLSNVLCGCFPLAIGLGIGAIVKHGKAKQAAQAEPGRFLPPSSTGLVTGIIGIAWTLFALAYIGIISAVAVPALLGQRERAREKAVQAYVMSARAEAVGVAETLPKGPEGSVDPEAVVKALLAKPAFQLPVARNPFAPQECVFMAGDAPERDGQVALRGGYKEEGGQRHPAVQIRAQVRRNGKPEITSTVITLD